MKYKLGLGTRLVQDRPPHEVWRRGVFVSQRTKAKYFIEHIHCANSLLYGTVFYSAYLNIHLKIKYTHQRIKPYTRVRILKYNRSRDMRGNLANC